MTPEQTTAHRTQLLEQRTALLAQIAQQRGGVIGRAEVRKVYKVSGVGVICGSYVTNGSVVRNASVRIIRDGIEIFEGKTGSLKRFKDDVKEVHTGYECGIGVENYNDIKENDILEFFRLKEIERVI